MKPMKWIAGLRLRLKCDQRQKTIYAGLKHSFHHLKQRCQDFGLWETALCPRYLRYCQSNASSILLHLIVIELIGFQHFLLVGGHRRSEGLGPYIGCMYAGQSWVACLEGKRYGQERLPELMLPKHLRGIN
jgi:hypothetical protein